MGTLNGTKLTWHDSHKFDSYSTNPSVAVYPCIKLVGNPVTASACGVEVLEVHNDNAAPGPLWYCYGHSDDGSTIPELEQRGGAVIYGSGWNPKIAWASSLLEVHNGQAGAGPLGIRSVHFWVLPIIRLSSLIRAFNTTMMETIRPLLSTPSGVRPRSKSTMVALCSGRNGIMWEPTHVLLLTSNPGPSETESPLGGYGHPWGSFHSSDRCSPERA